MPSLRNRWGQSGDVLGRLRLENLEILEICPSLGQILPAVPDDQNPFHSRPKKLQVGWKKNHDSGRDHLFLVYMSYEGPTCPLAKSEVVSKWWVSVRDL